VFCIQSAKDSLKRIAEQRQFSFSSGERQSRIVSSEEQFQFRRKSVQLQFSGNKTVPRKQQNKYSDSYSFCVVNL
jgi:hypothetical protein